MEENKDFLRQDNNYRTLKAFKKPIIPIISKQFTVRNDLF